MEERKNNINTAILELMSVHFEKNDYEKYMPQILVDAKNRLLLSNLKFKTYIVNVPEQDKLRFFKFYSQLASFLNLDIPSNILHIPDTQQLIKKIPSADTHAPMQCLASNVNRP